jgi:hypothetical protein
MLRDVFYYGKKPNVHPRERYAENLEHARSMATTEHFWVINESCDYRNFDWDFDFEFLPDEDVWAESHNNVWPSQHQKDSGTWLCSTEFSDIIIYRNDVEPVRRKNEKHDAWVILDNVDESKFDFSWHPDPTSPPYIYKWGTKFFPAQLRHVLEYRVKGATQEKYLDKIVELLPETDRWVEYQTVDREYFDLTWRPDPMEPPYIYVWGNKYVDGKLQPTLEYHAPNATNKKYMPEPLKVLPEWDRWVEHVQVDKTKFDFSWRPDPREPAYNYVWGNKYEEAELKPTLEYRMPGATAIKYMPDHVPVVPQWDRWVLVDKTVDKDKFDFTWRPDPREPAYIYTWGNKYISAELQPTLEYRMEGATERKYMGNTVDVLPQWDIWVEVQTIDKELCVKNNFDFSWRPDPREPAYIYTWGNKFIEAELKPTLEYRMSGATERKYMGNNVEVLPQWDRWVEQVPVDKERSTKNGFDFSWRPDPREPAFIYTWGNKYEEAELKPTLEYKMDGATERKYMGNDVEVLPQWDRWNIIHDVIKSTFDFSWRPDPREPALTYVFGNELYDGTIMPTIEYKMKGATEKKYINDWTKPKLKPNKNLFEHLEDSYNIDYSWRPNPTSPPYIYAWGNQWNKPEDKISIQYVVEGATEYKYMEERATRKPCMDNWEVPENLDVSKFDFSWEPSPADPPYIYQFGTQWQKTGGPRYVVPGATEVKYMGTLKARRLPSIDNWTVPSYIDKDSFDFSWHPDDTSPPYVYQFPTQWAIAGGPVYTVEGAKENKFVDSPLAKAKPNKDNWEVNKYVDSDLFDYSWHPYVDDEPYIYQFGTQHQKTGGHRYITPGTHKNSPVMYVDARILKSKRLENKSKFTVLNDYKIKEFDYSWHPDETEEPYIYVFGNNQYPAEIMPTIEYRMPGATQVKYVNNIIATLDTDLTNWEIPDNVDTTGFDFSWKPNPKEPAYIYEFATQWQKTGGPRYIVEDATEVKYLDSQKVKRLPSTDNWTVPSYIDKEQFDFSWHPDATSPAYIYHFPTQWALSGGPTYTVEGAVESKFVEDQQAVALVDKTNWEYDTDLIDETSFDFSWHPYIEDQPYIYVFGTQHQKTGGPKYITPGCHKNSPVKYIDTRILKAKRLPCMDNWKIIDDVVVDEFDYSWHPDETEEPYIYQFGNNQYSAEIMPTLEYKVKGATQIKYVNTIVARLGKDLTNWEIPNNIDTSEFDFSWKPNPKDPAYVYEFGTQWQKTDGPCYVVKGATERKYIDGSKAKRLSSKENWTIPSNIDITGFDFSWHPDNTSPAYIYVFATQWALSGGPVYTVPGATETKYVEDQSAKSLPDKTNWEFDSNLIDETSFDFSWHPYVEDQPYIYQFGTQWQKTGGPVYKTPGVHKNSPVKYIDTRILKAKRLPNGSSNWNTLHDYQIVDFDYSWHPDDTDEPYIYVFGNKYYSAEQMPTIEYRMPGATQVKYVHSPVATLAQDKTNWDIPTNVDISNFDFSWKPSPLEPAYIYQFGTQWAKTRGPRYVVKGAKEVKYIDSTKAKALDTRKNWEIPKTLDISEFDFSWHPDDTDPPYIYQFGTQWALTGGPRYVVEGAKEVKYVESIIAKARSNMTNWEVPANIDNKSFDFSWHPYAEDDPFIYQFGTQHQKTGGPRYLVPGATKIKYVDTRVLKAKRLPDRTNWYVPENTDVSKFDFSWHPDETADPAIYQFGSVVGKDDGPRYIVPNNDGKVLFLENLYAEETEEKSVAKYFIETTLEDLISLHPDEVFWALNRDLDYSKFDFDWRPDVYQSNYIHAFGSRDNIDTQTYFVNAVIWEKGFRNINYIEDDKIQIKANLDMFYVDRGNPEAQARFDALKARFPKIQKTRYLNSWVDTINRCTNRASTSLLWVLNSELDYSNFDFEYYPNAWQMKMVHVFGTQWSHWGTTFMVNRESFSNDTKYIKIIEHLNNLNFVKDNRAKATKCIYDIVLIDHGNSETTTIVEQLKQKAQDKQVITVKYSESYLNTLHQILSKQPEKKEHYLWICSSVCDYRDFDFSYVCDPFAKDQLHVFPSGKQKFGDTFFIDVNKTREIISDMKVLEDYHKVNYNSTMRVSRLPEPIISISDDTMVNIAQQVNDWPYATIISEGNSDIEQIEVEPMNLWQPDTKNIMVTSTGATRIIVPREAKDFIKKELYDYPYIKKSAKLAKSNPLDIVFLSNGETGADENYEHLLKITKGLKNRVVRVDGVNGRAAAYHAAAEASNTPWMFTVFAKLKVSAKFDWNWQPDRMQVPKHYIFQAKNPVNGLVYGHQAMIAYNKRLTLANEGKGLDFTLDDEHEVVELLSGTAMYNTDSFSTWRTAFREVLKLRAEDSDVARERLDAWMNKAEGDFAQYSIQGAVNADEYYDEVDGDFEQLKLSYEWAWLRERFEQL